MKKRQWDRLKYALKMKFLTDCSVSHKDAREIVVEGKELPERIVEFIRILQPDKDDNAYQCFNFCPNCGAHEEDDILWGDKEWGGESAWQNGTCNKCGCEFTEVYGYCHTEIDAPKSPT